MYDATEISYNAGTKTWSIEGTNPAAVPRHDLEQMQDAGWRVGFDGTGLGWLYTYSAELARLAARRLDVPIAGAEALPEPAKTCPVAAVRIERTSAELERVAGWVELVGDELRFFPGIAREDMFLVARQDDPRWARPYVIDADQAVWVQV